MLEFRTLRHVEEPRPARMTLREYARFCERCVRGNPCITPENCLTKRTDEAEIKIPFRIPPDAAPGPSSSRCA